MNPLVMSAVINGKRYNTETATLLAGDDYWDGHNYERHGTNTFLYRTPKGAYFLQDRTQWEGQRDALTPLTQAEAMDMWERLSERRVEFEDAFPGVTVEDA